MFIPNISILCLLGIVGLFYLEQSSLLPLGTSHDTILSVQWILPFWTHVDVITVPVVYRSDQIFYLYFQFERCSFYIQLIISHKRFLLLVPLVISIECGQLFYTYPEVG